MHFLISTLLATANAAAPAVESTADGGLKLSGSTIAFVEGSGTLTIGDMAAMQDKLNQLEEKVASLSKDNVELKEENSKLTGLVDRVLQLEADTAELQQTNQDQDAAVEDRVRLRGERIKRKTKTFAFN